MFAASARLASYQCPGERGQITRSVHLGRLAAGYAGCARCPHRHDGLPPGEAVRWAWPPIEGPDLPWSLFQREGARGVALNELGRAQAGAMASAFACLIRECEGIQDTPPMAGAAEPETAGDEGLAIVSLPHTGPMIALSCDERPLAPELAAAAASALRRAGCLVVDLGSTTRPCFWHAVHELNAAGGVHVTGGGGGWSVTGFDFVGRGAVPFSWPGSLERIPQFGRDGSARRLRLSGRQQLHRALPPYEATLWRHFHALRPLRVGFASTSRLVTEQFERVFQRLACRLHVVPAVRAARRDEAAGEGNQHRVARAVREGGLHLGILVGDDGQRLRVIDDRGATLPHEVVARLLARAMRAEDPNSGPFPGIDDQDRGAPGAATLEAAARAMRHGGARMGANPEGYYWFAEPFPTCDAVIALARLMQTLSQSDRPLSEVAEGLSGSCPAARRPGRPAAFDAARPLC